MKRKKRNAASALLPLALLGVFLALFLSGCKTEKITGGDSVRDGYLLTIDGYGVTEDEFRLFLNDQKAATANYFWTEYQVQPDADFWTTAVNGETPLDYAKERALDALVSSKMIFLLAAERGIYDYRDYNRMIADMDAENADRAAKLETGEVFYGVTEFNPFTYYQYFNTNLKGELEKSQKELSTPSQAELERMYKENYENFSKGVVYRYEVIYSDGRREEVSQNSMEIGKEDYTAEELVDLFQTMEPGEMLTGFYYRDQYADVVLTEKTHQGYLPFEEAKDGLHTMYARQMLAQELADRAERAELQFDQSRFDALQM